MIRDPPSLQIFEFLKPSWCYFDDAVHDVLGLMRNAWQSVYHFAMGVPGAAEPVDDARLTSEPGYPWEVDTADGPGRDAATMTTRL